MMMLLLRLKDAVESATYGNSALKTLVDNVYTRLGAPAGASLAADIASVLTRLGTPSGASVSADIADFLIRFKTASVKVYPTLAADVVLTESASANTLGAFATVVPASTITSAYYVDTIDVSAISAGGVFEIVLYHGASDTEFARARFVATGRLALKASKQITANDQIRAKVASVAGGVKTVNISISYHS